MSNELLQELEILIQEYIQNISDGQFQDSLVGNEKRVQGKLVLLGYELCAGSDFKMITRAAQAIEMIHAAVLCLDEGNDEAQARQALHQGEIILANLRTDAENKIKVLSITNRTLMLVARAKALPKDDDVTYWRATECALNPLHVGMVLAGADCHATTAVTPETLAFGEQLLAGDNTQTVHLLAEKLAPKLA